MASARSGVSITAAASIGCDERSIGQAGGELETPAAPATWVAGGMLGLRLVGKGAGVLDLTHVRGLQALRALDYLELDVVTFG